MEDKASINYRLTKSSAGLPPLSHDHQITRTRQGPLERLVGRVEKKMIGLMGIKNDGKTLVTPSGKTLFPVPRCIARIVQRIQHAAAMRTWRNWKPRD